jgi:hypothetical protein
MGIFYSGPDTPHPVVATKHALQQGIYALFVWGDFLSRVIIFQLKAIIFETYE